MGWTWDLLRSVWPFPKGSLCIAFLVPRNGFKPGDVPLRTRDVPGGRSRQVSSSRAPSWRGGLSGVRLLSPFRFDLLAPGKSSYRAFVPLGLSPQWIVSYPRNGGWSSFEPDR